MKRHFQLSILVTTVFIAGAGLSSIVNKTEEPSKQVPVAVNYNSNNGDINVVFEHPDRPENYMQLKFIPSDEGHDPNLVEKARKRGIQLYQLELVLPFKYKK